MVETSEAEGFRRMESTEQREAAAAEYERRLSLPSL